MDEERFSITTFLMRVLVIFSCTILFLVIVGVFIGDEVKEITTIFGADNQGIPYAVIFQALILSLYGNAMRLVFLSKIILKNMMVL